LNTLTKYFVVLMWYLYTNSI